MPHPYLHLFLQWWTYFHLGGNGFLFTYYSFNIGSSHECIQLQATVEIDSDFLSTREFIQRILEAYRPAKCLKNQTRQSSKNENSFTEPKNRKIIFDEEQSGQNAAFATSAPFHCNRNNSNHSFAFASLIQDLISWAKLSDSFIISHCLYLSSQTKDSIRLCSFHNLSQILPKWERHWMQTGAIVPHLVS